MANVFFFLFFFLKEYELAEDELNISFDRFRSEYGDSDGSIK